MIEGDKGHPSVIEAYHADDSSHRRDRPGRARGMNLWTHLEAEAATLGTASRAFTTVTDAMPGP